MEHMAKESLPLQAVLKPIIRFFFRVFTRIRLEGREHLPSRPPYLVFSNHISWFDPLLVGSFTPGTIHIMAMEAIFRFRPLGWLLRQVGAFPVNRGILDRHAIEEAIHILARGGVVLIFPEGGIGRMRKGERPRSGISLIAQRANAPLLPVGISGCRGLYRPFALLTRRVRITLRMGVPFLVPADSSLPGKTMRKAAMERVVREMCVLSGGETLLSARGEA